jgi:hypothetical protein
MFQFILVQAKLAVEWVEMEVIKMTTTGIITEEEISHPTAITRQVSQVKMTMTMMEKGVVQGTTHP